MKRILFCAVASVLFAIAAQAQTDIHIAGAKVGFPIAVPTLCDTLGSGGINKEMADRIIKNLEVVGIFKVIDPSSYVEEPGKCNLNDVGFNDWTVIGTEGLVKGRISQGSNGAEFEMILYDVNQRRPVVGKRYQADTEDAIRIANRFSNEIVKYFTGEAGVFGTRIAYVSKVGRFKELFMMDMDGSNSRQITTDRGLALSPSWSPAGDRLVYTSYRTRRPELFFISPEGGTPQQITNSPDLEIAAKFLPGGRGLVVANSVGGISNIVEMDFRGRIVRKISGGGALDVSPTLSPDGSQLAFTSDRGGSPQIYVMGIGGGNPHRVSFTGSNYCSTPSWSPKGDKLAFSCRDRGGFQIFVTGIDGGQAIQLTFGGNNEDPNWAPDGRSIAFSSNMGGGARSIAVYSLLGASTKKISTSRSEDSMPSWSPLQN